MAAVSHTGGNAASELVSHQQAVYVSISSKELLVTTSLNQLYIQYNVDSNHNK